jgi:hypothetical protein
MCESELDSTGSVPSFCLHGNELSEFHRNRGISYQAGRQLTPEEKFLATNFLVLQRQLSRIFFHVHLQEFVTEYWSVPGSSRQVFRKPGVGIKCSLGRAIAQAVSRWLPTAAARVRSRI